MGHIFPTMCKTAKATTFREDATSPLSNFMGVNYPCRIGIWRCWVLTWEPGEKQRSKARFNTKLWHRPESNAATLIMWGEHSNHCANLALQELTNKITKKTLKGNGDGVKMVIWTVQGTKWKNENKGALLISHLLIVNSQIAVFWNL